MSAQATWISGTLRATDTAGRWGFGLLIAMALFALFGPVISRFDPAAINLAGRLAAPSGAHWFGTDELGRDLFARVAFGARLSLLAAVSVVSVTIALGILIGGLAGLIGGFFETVIMRAVDIMLSIPALVLAIALAAALGPSLVNALIALVVVRLPVFIRLARAQTLAIKSRAFVDAARMAGAGRLYQLRHNILPNLMGIMLVQGLMDMAGVVLAAAALGFIGLGAQPPTPEWGALVASGRHFALAAWWYGVFPGAALLITAIAFNLAGDAVRDILDPRMGAQS